MELEYYYSGLANVLFLIFGIVLLGFGLDVLFYKTLISEELNPPVFVAIITLFLGTLLTSGFFVDIVKGKKVLISANESGVTINMEKPIFISWKDIYDIKRTVALTALNEPGRRVASIGFQIRSGSIQWPAIMVSRHHVKFQRNQEFDEITVDAWLNKSKETIVNELMGAKKQYDLITPNPQTGTQYYPRQQ
jgi:hypothetical protein